MRHELKTIVVATFACLGFGSLRGLSRGDAFLLKLVSDRNIDTSGGKLVHVNIGCEETVISDLGLGRFGEFLKESRLFFAALNL